MSYMSDENPLSSLEPAEIERLESGLPELKHWSKSLLVPFIARKLKRVEVVWLNERWFLERGVDVAAENTRARAINWIHQRFAYLIPTPADDPEAFTGPPTTLFADRYGNNTGLFAHGGSGRVATIGRFQVKGVGVTPLVGRGVNRAHSHGCASMNVALREVIYSEVAAAEFPFGAVPVIAVLDTGLTFASSGSKNAPSRKLKRALIVRPAVIRPAHMQRAPAFLHSVVGYKNVQTDDVDRVREVIGAYASMCGADEQNPIPDLRQHFRRVIRQIAFGQAQRLYNGGYFSSNLSIDGSLLDFGNMHAIPNWNNIQVLDEDAGFGKELQVVSNTIKSLEFHFQKYLRHSPLSNSLAGLKREIYEWHERDFAHECLKLWQLENEHVSPSIRAIKDSLLQLFKEQQRKTINFTRDELPPDQWLSEALHDAQPSGSQTISSATRALNIVQAALQTHFELQEHSAEKIERCCVTAERLLKTRTGLMRSGLQAKVNLLLDESDSADERKPEILETFIQSVVDSNRRHWPHLPGGLSVLGHVSSNGCSLLACYSGELDQHYWWLEGIECGDELCFFSERLFISEFAPGSIKFHGAYWSVLISAKNFDMQRIQLNTRCLEFPRLTVAYASPRDRV